MALYSYMNSVPVHVRAAAILDACLRYQTQTSTGSETCTYAVSHYRGTSQHWPNNDAARKPQVSEDPPRGGTEGPSKGQQNC